MRRPEAAAYAVVETERQVLAGECRHLPAFVRPNLADRNPSDTWERLRPRKLAREDSSAWMRGLMLTHICLSQCRLAPALRPQLPHPHRLRVVA